MKKQKIFCEKCSDQIKNRHELVTTTIIFSVTAYHEHCYAKDLKGPKSFVLDNYPLNGFSGNFMFVLSIIIAILFLLFTDNLWLALLTTIPIGYRLFSYFVYEIHTT
ncbi:hypothetical protein ACERII_24615 [Evansella sp. AB-rgal1]|uniref:hypothetical protein n=1 Tax=Evansella sp. AB-rgal1 TaxID=3242696 RepID=UPI00359DC569